MYYYYCDPQDASVRDQRRLCVAEWKWMALRTSSASQSTSEWGMTFADHPSSLINASGWPSQWGHHIHDAGNCFYILVSSGKKPSPIRREARECAYFSHYPFRKKGIPLLIFDPPHFQILFIHKNSILPFVGLQVKNNEKVVWVGLTKNGSFRRL